MRKFIVGIDISKEKMNLCLLDGMKIVREDETTNMVESVSKWIRNVKKSNKIDLDGLIFCAEYTGRYIFPLTVACHEEGVFLWMEDPTRIKNSFGITRGKNDAVDARRIAEYAARHQDKAVAYKMPAKALASIKILMADRDLVLSDKKKYEAQLNDQKRFMSKEDYAMQCKMWRKILKVLQGQLEYIDQKVDELVASDESIAHQVELLKSIDGVGQCVAVNMVVCTEAFTRFDNARQFNCYAGLAPFTYTSGKSVFSKAKVSQRANKQMKSLLHMAAVCAATHVKSSEFRDYYNRRRSEGKHPMCILNVIRAKLVSRMFAVIKRDERYSHNYERVLSEKKLSTPLEIS